MLTKRFWDHVAPAGELQPQRLMRDQRLERGRCTLAGRDFGLTYGLPLLTLWATGSVELALKALSALK